MKKQISKTEKTVKVVKVKDKKAENIIAGASRTFEQVGLLDISVNPLNPRKNFSGPKYDELLASVKAKGVLVPIMVRPLPVGSPTPYEIIAGERRYRVSCDLARNNGGMEKSVIPALIQELSDDDAFDVMTIENLQRADLTPLEEAQAFQLYLEKKGIEALPDLAERVGIKPCYIRRRTSVLGLPEKILTAWEEGKLQYGHLDQLIRISDQEDLEEAFIRAHQWHWTVKQVKDHIDGKSPKLSKALFDWKKSECATCHQNTNIQRSLFGDDIAEKSLCLNPKCFKEHQQVWIKENWSKFKSSRDLQTNGATFQGDVDYNQYETIWKKMQPKCRDCDHYQALIHIDGSIWQKAACLGEKKCYREQYDPKSANDGKEKDPNAPRVSWHGEFFREEFYKARLPELMTALPSDDDKVLRILLLSLLETHHGAAHVFREKNEMQCWEYDAARYYWPKLEKMEGPELRSVLQELSLIVLMDKETTRPDTRRSVAVHLGSDLASEWKMTKEYLDKKTTREIQAIAEQFGIWKDEKALAYLSETLGKKQDRFDLCKKGELVKIILESGIDLSGKVPSEILAEKSA
ncbi:MAG: ParB/RepB/Spo0J family partition protein [Syntrophaceae bacterium]|nr:ParB/RepB/Spo0J family partition protein [Syntrophaceae bacterium]